MPADINEININKLEKLAKKTLGGKIIKGRLFDFKSILIIPRFPLSLFRSQKAYIDMRKNTISIKDRKYYAKASELKKEYEEFTGQDWELKINY
jgi:hypothetical protein